MCGEPVPGPGQRVVRRLQQQREGVTEERDRRPPTQKAESGKSRLAPGRSPRLDPQPGRTEHARGGCVNCEGEAGVGGAHRSPGKSNSASILVAPSPRGRGPTGCLHRQSTEGKRAQPELSGKALGLVPIAPGSALECLVLQGSGDVDERRVSERFPGSAKSDQWIAEKNTT